MTPGSTSWPSPGASRTAAGPSPSGSISSPSAGARSAGQPGPDVEGLFRLWAFHIFYRRTFSSEVDRFLRFGKALEASSRAILRPELVEEWSRQYGDRSLAELLRDAEEPDGLQLTLFMAPGRRRTA